MIENASGKKKTAKPYLYRVEARKDMNMERLTPAKEEREAEGIGYAKYLNQELCQQYDKRLSEYEDTELNPYQIHLLKLGCKETETELSELKQKIQDGRLVELPCKVGDTIMIETGITGCATGKRPFMVTGIRLDLCADWGDSTQEITASLSEAEAALREGAE